MQRITFDGYDGSELMVRDINLWCDYFDRTKTSKRTGKQIVATVKHGSKGVLLERLGNGCKVRVKDGGRLVEGWVSYYFVKELKQEWQAERFTPGGN